MRPKTGTREWAEVNKNICRGCKHNCLYCYARRNAVRFKQIRNKDEWTDVQLVYNRLYEKPRNLLGKRIMFPTTHDILPEYIDETIKYLSGWLSKGNEILIVSKPHLECIQKICDHLSEYKKQIVFRFTIGSNDDLVLKFWEPGAPDFGERLNSLVYAHNRGFTTSVSCEPFLDGNIVQLVNILLPYITDTIWVGKMNRIKDRIDTTEWSGEAFTFLDKIYNSQTDSAIHEIYSKLKDNPKVRWKDSIKKVMGLAEEAIG